MEKIKTPEEFLKEYSDIERQYGNIEITFDGLTKMLQAYHSQFSSPQEVSGEWIDMKECTICGVPNFLHNKTACGWINAACPMFSPNDSITMKPTEKKERWDYFKKHFSQLPYPQGWTDVKKSRPEIAKIVIMILKDQVKETALTGFRANGGWYFFQIGEQSKHFLPNDHPYMKIIKWQPLPALQTHQ